MKIGLFRKLFKESIPSDFHIGVVKDYPKNFTHSNTPIRVMSDIKYIEIKKDTVKNGSDFELYLLLRWCFHQYNFNGLDISSKEKLLKSDDLCINDCVKTGVNDLVIFKAFYKYLSHKPNEFNSHRIKLVLMKLKPSLFN